MPADSATMAIVSGYDVTLRSRAGWRVRGSRAADHVAAVVHRRPAARAGHAGLRRDPFEFVPADAPIEIPHRSSDSSLRRRRASTRGTWVRAGMQYRDLIPGRLGGRFIASHIRIPDGGDVPDYVHYHRIRSR
jgi:hypothetical protein